MNHVVSPPRLMGELIRIRDVTKSDRDEMFRLMTRYYENMDRRAFERDFDSKHWVIVARCPAGGTIRGFSTQWFGGKMFGGENVGVLYSGDTIIDRKYWAKNPLATVWGKLVLELVDRFPDRPLVWFLISKGYKTYRFLPVFFRDFYPTPDRAFPSWYQNLLRQIATEKFPDRYSPSTGVIHAQQRGCRLRPELVEMTVTRMHDPYVQFFTKANPDHARGDELCCIAPLSRHNFNEAAFRVIAMPYSTKLDTETIDGGLDEFS